MGAFSRRRNDAVTSQRRPGNTPTVIHRSPSNANQGPIARSPSGNLNCCGRAGHAKITQPAALPLERKTRP
jgi:hypothetical protein